MEHGVVDGGEWYDGDDVDDGEESWCWRWRMMAMTMGHGVVDGDEEWYGDDVDDDEESWC